MRKVIALGGAALMTALSITSVRAAEAPAKIQKDCAVCHQMSGPASPDLAARQTRKGPPLFFTGNKFRRDWLLSGHPAVDAPAAKQIADYLMTLTPNTALLAKEDYTPGRVSARIGAMDFVKFKGCSGCHKDTPKYGGFSGPELHTAWQRLQPPFIVSYIRDPAAWEPRTLMPNKHLNTAGIHKLANYLRTIGEKPEKAK